MLALALLGCVFGATLQTTLVGLEPFDYETTSLVLRDVDTLERRRAPVMADGTVVFHDVDQTHQHLLSLDSDTLELPWSYVVKKAADEDWDIRKVQDGQALTTGGSRLDMPLEIRGFKRAELVVDRPEFSIFKFFTQKSVLLSVGALLAVTYLPAWLASLDPEALEELQKNQVGGSGK